MKVTCSFVDIYSFLFFALIQINFAYYCQNRKIEILGETSTTESFLYDQLSLEYEKFRAQHDMDVKVKIVESISQSNWNKVFWTERSKFIDDHIKIITPILGQ